jgi:hypothetical protein
MSTDVTYDEATKRAKRWGKANGYAGRPGGWIYRTGPTATGAPICQGWNAFYWKYRRYIEAVAA